MLGPHDLASHIGEGVHVGLRKGTDAPSSAEMWKAIAESEDNAWGEAVEYCLWGLSQMYPDGFEFDPDKPADKPQHVMDRDSVVWVWNPRIRKVRGRWADGAYVPRDSLRRTPDDAKNAVLTLEMLRDEHGPLLSIEIEDEV